MNTEIPTPRTDANTYGSQGVIGSGYVSADFARQLERELVEANDRARHLDTLRVTIAAKDILIAELRSQLEDARRIE